jgi:hypothetical protein
LRVAYHSFRERAALLAAEIPQDLREYTVHDASHLDALWELADLIAGQGVTLTPTEGFVLGGAFLIHDLGMGIAAWPGGMQELMSDEGWRDILVGCVSNLLGRPPGPDEIDDPGPDALRLAQQIALREKHAARAADLALISWKASGTDASYHLIQDEDLRDTYGHLIGRLAASHWWSIERVSSDFPDTPLGAPVDCPDEWTVDPLKLACLLRLADIAHVDARRAPNFLRAVRRPSELADRHWVFQSHLQRPRLDDDRLVYTAARPFTVDEAAAWWLCYETLQQIDRELHSVDALFADKSRTRFAARSVKGVDSPFRLGSLIPTSEWEPVDARVVVSNVPALVRKLGGASLYGYQPNIALRELIQNASDATRALTQIIDRPPLPIKICLYRGRDEFWYLDVVDAGVGMSQQVMTGPLLDFGNSYWGSDLMRQEFPNLASSHFRPIGRFGIGFYSVFMLSDSVRVISRRYDEASAATRVLQFNSGPDERPIMRPAKREELLNAGGTIVSIRLREDPYEPDGLLVPRYHGKQSLMSICARLAPALPSDLMVAEPGNESGTICVKADDWTSMEGVKFISRISVRNNDLSLFQLSIEEAAANLRTIEVDGKIVARATLAIGSLQTKDEEVLDETGIVTAGGLAAESAGGVIGVFAGVPTKADRSTAVILAPPGKLSEWASEQAVLWKDRINAQRSPEWDMNVGFLARLGADLSEIHVCCSRAGYMSSAEVQDWARDKSMIILLSRYPVDTVKTEKGLTFWNFFNHQELFLDENVIIAPSSATYGNLHIWGDESPDKRWEPDENEYRIRDGRSWWYFNQLALEGVILKSIVTAWGCDLEEVLDSMEFEATVQFMRYKHPNVVEDEEASQANIRPQVVFTRPLYL